MNMQPLLLALVAFGMAFAATPVQATGCTGADQCETVTGPGSAEIQGVGSAGIGLCQAETADLPLFCEAAPGSLGGAGAGAATFDSATGGVGWSGAKRSLTINIEYNLEAPCLAATLVCGFNALICNDRDLDSSCTNIGDQDDELVDAYSNEPATDVDCGDGKKDDEKDCDDNDGTTLGKTVCFSESVYSGGLGTRADPASPDEWNNVDQIVVFIGVWVGKVTTDAADANAGAGASVGTYDVGLNDNGSSTCDNSGGVTTSTGCIWEADAASAEDSVLDDAITAVNALTAEPADVNAAVTAITSGPVVAGSGTCEDDGGNQSVFSCAGGSAVVVFVIGVGSSVATGSGDCPSVSAAFPGVPVNADTVGTGGPSADDTFTCDYDWSVIAVGGCITV